MRLSQRGFRGAKGEKRLSYLLLILMAAAVAVGWHWRDYQHTAQMILSSEELTLEVMEGLGAEGLDMKTFQDEAALPVQRYLACWLVQLLVQMIVIWISGKKGLDSRSASVILICIMALICVSSLFDLAVFMGARYKLLMTNPLAYVLLYILFCVVVPLGWSIERGFRMRKRSADLSKKNR